MENNRGLSCITTKTVKEYYSDNKHRLPNQSADRN